MKKKYLILSFLTLTVVFASCKKDVELPTLTSLEAFEITQTTAKSGGNITDNGGGAISASGIVWHTTENPRLDNNSGMTNDGAVLGEFISIITELIPSETYYVRAYATNSAGTAYGNQIVFQTEENPVLAILTTLEISQVTTNSAISGGAITSDGGAEVTARGIVWSTNSNPNIDENEGLTENGSGIGNYTCNLTELEPQTTYYVRAYATNSIGTAYGNELEFTTEGTSFQTCPGIAQVTDVDGNIYNTVLIGDQCWFIENLKTTKLNDNLIIQNLTDANDWTGATNPAYVWYDNDIANKDLYGAIYNYYTVQTGILCPQGWLVAGDLEWKILEGTVDSEHGVGDLIWNEQGWRGSDAGKKLKAENGWNNQGHGTNEYGFTALPGGFRNAMTGDFERIGDWANWWAADESEPPQTFRRYINNQNDDISKYNSNPNSGYYVRCVKHTNGN